MVSAMVVLWWGRGVVGVADDCFAGGLEGVGAMRFVVREHIKVSLPSVSGEIVLAFSLKCRN